MTSVTIKGVQFEVPDDPSIVAGAIMTEGQAHSLLQTRRENVRNNFSARVEKALNGAGDLEADTKAALQAELDDYLGRYQFGIRASGGGVRRTDPVEKEMLRIAKADIAAAYFTKHGERLKGDVLTEAAERLLEQKGEDYNRRARQAMADQAAAAESVLAGIAA